MNKRKYDIKVDDDEGVNIGLWQQIQHCIVTRELTLDHQEVDKAP